LLTSFYMFRLIFMTFCGAPRYDEHETHVHESPSNMVTPLVILAVLSIVGGWFAAPALWGGVDYFERFLSPVFATPGIGESTSAAELAAAATTEHQLMAAAIASALIGLFLAWWMYIKRPDQPAKLAKSLSGPYKLLLGKYFVDEIYAAVIVRPLVWISRNVLWHVVDEKIIDGAVNGVADTTRHAGNSARQTESGNTRSYAAWIVVGAVAFTSLLLWLAVR
jgi:NADH-quinone oxidoreductase subunit L